MIVHQSRPFRTIHMLIVDSCDAQRNPGLQSTGRAPVHVFTLHSHRQSLSLSIPHHSSPILSPRPNNANGAQRSRPRGLAQLLQPSSCRVNPTRSTRRPKKWPHPVFLSWDRLPLLPLQIRDLRPSVSPELIPWPLQHSALCLARGPPACCLLQALDAAASKMEATRRTKSP